MSEAVTIDTTCSASTLAHEAASIISLLETCDLSAINRLFELETCAADSIARTRDGAIFQLAIISAHADLILSFVPSTSAELPRLEEIFGQLQRLAFSLSRFLAESGTSAASERILGYYFSNDPFSHH